MVSIPRWIKQDMLDKKVVSIPSCMEHEHARVYHGLRTLKKLKMLIFSCNVPFVLAVDNRNHGNGKQWEEGITVS